MILSVAALTLAACGKGPETSAVAPVEVGVATARFASVTPSDELPGRVVAYRIAEIRPQVSGVIIGRPFAQGSEVKAGQPLFQINPAPFRAEVNSAKAALDRVVAVFDRAKVQVDRLQPLVDADAISRQAYDDALASRAQAAADVAQARATLERRRLDLTFATVSAPISGRIGQTQVTEGALVGANDAGAMATVQQIDQVYIDVRQPSARLEALRGAAGGGDVEIVTSGGKVHAGKGKILFSDISVDPGTGDAVARVLAQNPDRALLPGMFVRARLPRAAMPNALVIPQQAVLRDGAGKPLINVVDAKGQVAPRVITVGDVVDGLYVVTAGLKPGERVIVEGHDRVQPGAPVKAVPMTAASPR